VLLQGPVLFLQCGHHFSAAALDAHVGITRAYERAVDGTWGRHLPLQVLSVVQLQYYSYQYYSYSITATVLQLQYYSYQYYSYSITAISITATV
jgi:hypothetical protein